ncbi:MAG: hypothetical protein MZV65_41370 [Chromatiales bacterium]|nr:hypothetical protein [Chromatiales bacterium]
MPGSRDTRATLRRPWRLRRARTATSACALRGRVRRGATDPARQHAVRDGQPGYRVLDAAASATDGRGWVLVDRGWVPLGAIARGPAGRRRSAAESAVSSAAALDALPTRRACAVGRRCRRRAAKWPRVMLVSRLRSRRRAALGYSLSSRRIVLLDAGAPRRLRARLAASTRGFGPERHLGYAVQWFAFARGAVDPAYLARQSCGAATLRMIVHEHPLDLDQSAAMPADRGGAGCSCCSHRLLCRAAGRRVLAATTALRPGGRRAHAQGRPVRSGPAAAGFALSTRWTDTVGWRGIPAGTLDDGRTSASACDATRAAATACTTCGSTRIALKQGHGPRAARAAAGRMPEPVLRPAASGHASTPTMTCCARPMTQPRHALIQPHSVHAGDRLASWIYLLDPLGNLLMRYPADAAPTRHCSRICKKLLRLSHIG